MDCFKHSVLFTDVCATCSTNTALEFSSFVSDNITIEVRKNEYLEISSALFINKLCSCDINIPFISNNFGIIFSNIFAKVKEFTISCFDDVCFCDDRNSFFFVVSCIFISKFSNSFCTFSCCYNKVEC